MDIGGARKRSKTSENSDLVANFDWMVQDSLAGEGNIYAKIHKKT